MTLPYIVESAGGGSMLDHVRARRAALRGLLREHGALLLRGFRVGGVDGFDAVVRGFSGDPLTYAERSSPRSTIKGNVYTSTDYPADEEIFLHNENSYQANWPLTLFFHCVSPPDTQGATPLADTRGVYARIDPAVRDEFTRRGWRVVRNFHGGFSTSWQHAFNTGDRSVVERYCAANGIEAGWRSDGGLRTTAVRRAVHEHPASGAAVWFNHATFFHHTTLPAEVSEGLLELFGEDDLPTNTYYGDGGRIPDGVVAHLRACYRAESTRFDWQPDDVLVVDNMLASHAREPFTGPRRIAVAMSEPYRRAAAGPASA